VSVSLYVVNGQSNSFVCLRWAAATEEGEEGRRRKEINLQIYSGNEQTNEQTGPATKQVRTAPAARLAASLWQTSHRLSSPFFLSYRVEQTDFAVA